MLVSIPLLIILIILASSTMMISVNNVYSQKENVTISMKTIGEILDNAFEAKLSLEQNNTAGVNSSLNAIEELLSPYNETLRLFSQSELSYAIEPSNMTALNTTSSPLENIISASQNMTAPNMTKGK